VGAVIFQLALLLSLWLFEDLFLGQIDMINTSFFQRITRSLLYGRRSDLSTGNSLQTEQTYSPNLQSKLAVFYSPYTAAVPQPLFKARSQTTCFFAKV
jgi:hypothetical protein